MERRKFIYSLGVSGMVLGGVNTVSAESNETAPNNEMTISDVAIHTAKHPNQSKIAFTSTFLGDGYQGYIAFDVDDQDSNLTNFEQITSAQAGVHGLEWIKGSSSDLKYSEDGKVYATKITDEKIHRPKLLNESPPAFGGDDSGVGLLTTRVSIPVPTPFGEYRVNARGPETGRLKCKSVGGNTPPIEHYQFEIVKSGDALSGVSFWTGTQVDASCFWVGEENYSEWCTKYCKGDGIPGVTWLSNNIEEALKKATDAAGIVVPAAILAAIAYAVAVGIVVKPPTGVPV